jgi:molybdopterin-binding protein
MRRLIISALLALLAPAALLAQGNTTLQTVPKGGTARTSFTLNCVLYGNAVSPLLCATSVNNGVLTFTASGTPTVATILPNAVQDNITRTGTILSGVWNATPIATAFLADNSVTNAKLRQGGPLSLLGRSANSTGNVADILAAAASDCVYRESGSTVGCGTIATAGIGANQVTDAKLRQSNPLALLGRSANSTGNVADILATAASSCVFRENASTVGCGQIATAGITNNAVDNTKLRQGGARTVIGVTGNATANVADIQATSSSDAVLRENGGNLAFGTIATAGIGANQVTDAKLRQSNPLALLGRSANSTGNVADILAAAASDCVYRESGSTVGCGTIATAGIGANQVTDAKLRQSNPLALLGRSANSTGNVADILAAAASDCVYRESGSTVGCGTIATAGIGANQVTDAKLRQSNPLALLGRSANSTGNVADILATAASSCVFRENASTVGCGQIATAGITNNAVDNTKLRQGGARTVIGVTGNATANVADIQATSSSDAVLRENGGNLAFGTIATAGIGANQVTDAKLRQSNPLALLGRSANSTGNVADILAAAASDCVYRESGSTVGCGTIATAGIGANQVTDAKLRQSNPLALLGRSANSTGNVADILAAAASDCVYRESGSTVGCGTIATAGIGANQVTNAKLAQIATATFKGRTTASTGNVEDLTAAQATALLNNMVGDSGSGGTKGMVPAPGAGDTAAARFLKADGSWAVPAGSGGGGMTDSERQNFLLSMIYQSKSFAGYRRGIEQFSDGYKASDGINAGSSVNQSVDTTNGRLAPSFNAGTNIATGGTPTCSTTFSTFACTNAFDANNGTSWLANATTATIKYVTGSGNIVQSYTVQGPVVSGDGGANASRSPKTWTMEGSNDGSSWTTLDTRSNETAWGTGETRTYPVSNSTSYTQYRLNITANNGDGSFVGLTDVTFRTADIYNPMIAVTTSQTADATVSNGRILIEYNPVDSVTLNTHLFGEVTCNGGSNWATATFSSAGTGQAGRNVAETADTACGAGGTSFAARLKTIGAKNVQIYGTTLTVH